MTAGIDARELEFARSFVAGREWRLAADPRNRHEYVVRGRSAPEADFDRFAALIRKRGWDGEWGGRTWRYLTVGEYTYWAIPPVLNRKPSAAVPRPSGAPATQDRAPVADGTAPSEGGSP